MHITAEFNLGPWDGSVADFDTSGEPPEELWGPAMAFAWKGKMVVIPCNPLSVRRARPEDVGPYVHSHNYKGREQYVWIPEGPEGWEVEDPEEVLGFST
jgi:hypothetical protein